LIISSTAFLQRNENAVMAKDQRALNSTEEKTIRISN